MKRQMILNSKRQIDSARRGTSLEHRCDDSVSGHGINLGQLALQRRQAGHLAGRGFRQSRSNLPL